MYTNSYRNGTVSSIAMSPSIASSPIRSTFPETAIPKKPSPPPPTVIRPAVPRGRQNSTQSIVEKRTTSVVSNRQNGNSTPDLVAAAIVTGKSVPEVKATMKETASNLKGEHILEDIEQEDPTVAGALLVNSRKDSVSSRREDIEMNGDAMQGVQQTAIMTKSGRASKPSTPAMSTFPEPARSRSSRAMLDNASNKRSHKKGAGAAAQLLAQQTTEVDDPNGTILDDEEDGEPDADEPTYCYCNGVSYGEMVGCDADQCEREWFHLECVGLKVAPKINGMFLQDLVGKHANCGSKMVLRRLQGENET